MFFSSKQTTKHCSVLLLILLAGCKQQKPTYKLKPLQPRTSYDQLTKKTETGEVTVRCTTCSRKDLHAIFGKQGNALLTKQNGSRLTPVQLYVENNSDYTWSLSPYDIRLHLADMQDVKDRFATGAAARGLTSFTLTSGCGIALAGFGAAASICHPILGASIIGAGCSLLFLAPVRSHNKTAQVSAQNMHFSHVIDAISLSEENLVIHPHEQASRLIYVDRKHIQDSFILRLCNQNAPDHTISYNLFFEPEPRK